MWEPTQDFELLQDGESSLSDIRSTVSQASSKLSFVSTSNFTVHGEGLEWPETDATAVLLAHDELNQRCSVDVSTVDGLGMMIWRCPFKGVLLTLMSTFVSGQVQVMDSFNDSGIVWKRLSMNESQPFWYNTHTGDSVWHDPRGNSAFGAPFPAGRMKS